MTAPFGARFFYCSAVCEVGTTGQAATVTGIHAVPCRHMQTNALRG